VPERMEDKMDAPVGGRKQMDDTMKEPMDGEMDDSTAKEMKESLGGDMDDSTEKGESEPRRGDMNDSKEMP
jgi:hypothetical protein